MLTALPAKQPVIGVGVSAANYGQLLRLSSDWIDERRSGVSTAARYIVVLTVHSVMTALFDPELRSILNRADIGTSDGMPLVWALRSFGVKEQRRVYGPDLMLALCGQAARRGHRVYFYGGREDSVRELCERLQRRFPALRIAGMHAPPFRPLTREEDEECVNRIVSSQADIVFVGIGAPKQERWMAEHRHQLPGVVMAGIGAAFDFHSGRIRQAPRWMQQAGLEWFFRLAMEPARLWRRYVFLNPLFLILWALQILGVLKYGPASAGRR